MSNARSVGNTEQAMPAYSKIKHPAPDYVGPLMVPENLPPSLYFREVLNRAIHNMRIELGLPVEDIGPNWVRKAERRDDGE